MASTKKGVASWLLWRLHHHEDADLYFVELWNAPGDGSDEMPSNALAGFPRRSVWSKGYRSQDGALRAAKALRSADTFDDKRLRDLGIRNEAPNAIVPPDPLIVVFGVFVEVLPDDAMTFRDEGLDPDTATVEEFYAVTGEWPMSSSVVRLDIRFVPAEWQNALQDLATMREAGWFVHDVVEQSDMSKGKEDKWIALLRSSFDHEVATRAHGSKLQAHIETFSEENAHPFWQSAGPYPTVPAKGG